MNSTPTRTTWLRSVFWMIGALALGLATYLVSVEKPRPVYQHIVDLSLLYLHIVGAVGALMVGPLLFLRASRRPPIVAFHRWFGRYYVLSIIVASSSSLLITRLYAPGGWVSQLGIAAAASAWGTSTALAWWSIRSRQVMKHRTWMIRSYALTLAFLTHHLWIAAATHGLTALGGNGAYGAPLGDWLFWTSNLVIAEGIIRALRQRKRSVPAMLVRPRNAVPHK